MIILDYSERDHKQIVHAAAFALTHGKVVAYPTDTSYGLAVDATNAAAIKKLYAIKGRDFKKPVHVIPASKAETAQWVVLNPLINKLTRAFWPGAFTVVAPAARSTAATKLLSAGTSTLGVRMPDSKIAQDLAKSLGRAITATSANVSREADCYSGDAVIAQYKNRKLKPDILIYIKKLPKRRPSSVVAVGEDWFEILRPGPVTSKQIQEILK